MGLREGFKFCTVIFPKSVVQGEDPRHRVHENVERYLTGLPSVIPGQPFEGERVKPETGKYTLPEVKVDPS